MTDKPSNLSMLLRSLLAIAVLAVFFGWLFPRAVDGDELMSRLRSIPPHWWWALGPLGAFNLCSAALSHRAAISGLSLRHALESDWSTSALSNTVPGGGAIAVGLTAAMYRSYGLDIRQTAQAVTLTGVFDTAIKLISPLLAVAWLSREQEITQTLAQAAVIGLFLAVGGFGVLVAVLRPGRLADWITRFVARFGRIGRSVAERLPDLQADALKAFSERGWLLAGWTFVGQVGLVGLLWACIRAVGVPADELSLAAIFAALAFGRLVTAIPLTPGGLGPMDAGLVASLSTVGSASTDAIAAAIVVFRGWTFAAPIPLGAISFVLWRSRSNKELRN